MQYRPNIYFQQLCSWLLLCIFAACNSSGAENKSDIIDKPEKMEAAVKRNIQAMLFGNMNNTGFLKDSAPLQSFESVKEFYTVNNYKNNWSEKEFLLPVADSFIKFIAKCKRYGLFPEDYHHQPLTSIQQMFAADTLAQNARRDAVLWSRADILLTDAFLTMARHVHKGRLKTDSIYNNYDSTLGNSYYHQHLNRFFENESITSILSQLEPRHKAYHDLKNAIPSFLDSADFSKRYTHLSYPYKDSIGFVKKLIRRLKEEGYVDGSVTKLDSASLAQVLKKVQKQRNLTVDGKFGNQLASSLNNTPIEKFKLIAVNLDRYKLMPDTLPKTYIWVNIPSYYLKLINDDTVVLESKIVVGTPKTRTPLLTSSISDIVTYPQWTIPNSIIIKEILPALKRNPGYLARKGYELFTWGGKPVDPYSVNWAKHTKGIPYKIVQGSGDANALGILKFNFPNQYSVYLHDTNQRYLFKNENRSLSHGCVRVQQWDKLAWYIFALDSTEAIKNNSNYLPSDSIRSWLARKEKHIIPVKTKVPVYFRYFTVIGKNGKLVFYNDIYSEDRQVREAYFSNK
jgi:murein L,D-transpeptidase YcbB/YkuD